MEWLKLLFSDSGTMAVAHVTLILALAAALGLALGSIKIRGISLGIGGVLFAGLALGHLLRLYGVHVPTPGDQRTAYEINRHVLDFTRDFGLILFVYTIGMQVGPGFFSSLRRQGLPLNLMAASIVVLGVVVTLTIKYAFHLDIQTAVGLLSGAVTNTPSLGAAGQAIKQQIANGRMAEGAEITPDLAYAVAYPFGIIGIILSMLLIRFLTRVDLARETQSFAQQQSRNTPRLATMNLEVTNANLAGLTVEQIPSIEDSGVVISRIMHEGRPHVARHDSRLELGDVLLAVGPKERLQQLKVIVGEESDVDLKTVPSSIATRRILVTQSSVLGKSVEDLNLRERFGVNITRINRAEIELPPTSNVKLQFADNLVAVGEEDALKQAAAELGDSPKKLTHPHIIPIFLGIALGVILGSWPISLGSMPAPVKLGLAGGPLVVAILLSRLGNIGPLVWYMPISANFMLREVGIVLFLASVGLMGGGQFVATLSQHGLAWMAYGAMITLIPLLVVGFAARLFFKVNYLSLCGLLAGSMTDPPALAFANTIGGGDAPSVSYATVYPLVMLLRVLFGQLLILVFV